MNEEFIPPEERGFSIIREVFDWVESGLTAVLCVVLIFTFVARMVGVVGESMYPTLHDKDRLIASRLYTELNSGDIVVITKPNTRNEPLIKRVIATGGQTIDIDSATGSVYVDGERIFEPYIMEGITPGTTFEMQFPQVVPMGHVFVMGDNRNNSWDSRSAAVGMVDERWVSGKVIYRIWPYESFGRPPYVDDLVLGQSG